MPSYDDTEARYLERAAYRMKGSVPDLLNDKATDKEQSNDELARLREENKRLKRTLAERFQ